MESREEWIGKLVEAKGLIKLQRAQGPQDHDEILLEILDEVIGDIESQLHEEWNADREINEDKDSGLWPPF